MNESGNESDTRLQAAEYVILLAGLDFNIEQWDRFQSWLEQSPANLQAYVAAQQTWDEAATLRVPETVLLPREIA